jgi:hypothetical protein
MATRGWEHVVDVRPKAPPRRKYRNTKVEVDGETFDSRAEANVWLKLCDRNARREIYDLKRQVAFALKTCVMLPTGRPIVVQVALYVADFVYWEGGQKHVIDVKRPATTTAIYRLKRRWLELQEGIVIEEVSG